MIDWQRVKDLRAEIGTEDFDEIVPIFLEEVTEITTRLKQNSSLDQLERDLHFLKGSALNLGFNEFSALCTTGEQMAAAGNAESVDIADILASFDASCAAFLTGLDVGKIA